MSRVLDRVGHEIAQDLPNQSPVRVRVVCRRCDAQFETLACCEAGELLAQLLKERTDCEVGRVGVDRA